MFMRLWNEFNEKRMISTSYEAKSIDHISPIVIVFGSCPLSYCFLFINNSFTLFGIEIVNRDFKSIIVTINENALHYV